MKPEIERKFLLRHKPEKKEHYYCGINQSYLLATTGEEIRLRHRTSNIGDASSYYLTIKSGTGLVRSEAEIVLNPAQYKALATAMMGNTLCKTRYRYKLDVKWLEVDVYHKLLEGLVIAEIEFLNEKEAMAFIMPDWLPIAKEVTLDERYKNRNLLSVKSLTALSTLLP